MNTVKFCDNCNSEIIRVKRGRAISVECSYCGEPLDQDFDDVEDFLDQDGDEE